jgi:hypothetical protein
MWCGICINPVLWCFNNLEGLRCGDLLVGMVPSLRLANGLRLGTAVPSEDLSGAWVIVHG